MNRAVPIGIVVTILAGCGADFEARKVYFADLQRRTDACEAKIGGEPFVFNPGLAFAAFGVVGGALAGLSAAEVKKASPEYQAWRHNLADCLRTSMPVSTASEGKT